MPFDLPRIEAIFSEALEFSSPQDRAAFLDRVCAGDPDSRRQVESLIAAHDRVGGFLGSPTVSFQNGPTEPVGAVIGPYKLLEPLGEGGMGVVYMAEQTHPVRRKVALKIIKPGMDTKQVIARFEAERQALALMDHPNIAKVLDAGATESGRPYFVMELVRGVPITDYCDKARLPVPERLALFVQVCQAVQHAHQKGIIHRDIKPSNVMVTLHDGVPVPKVIDFGVAKAMGQQLTEKTLFTAFAQLVGTPLYMSPEQAEMSGLDVDTRSDIYSLGVLLYELLTGTTPFDKETLRNAALDEVRRIIREDEPPKPSTRLSSLGATLTDVSARRGSDPRRLGKVVRGELDWIVMTALEKDRNRRYETANALAADVLRYLSDQPVQACPPSAWYRFSKTARRNRVALVTSALVATALVLGTAVSTWQAIRAVKAESKAEERSRFARKAVDEMYSEFCDRILVDQPRLTRVRREFLEKALTYYQAFAREHSTDPTAVIDESHALYRAGHIQSLLGQNEKAERSIRQCLALLEPLSQRFSSNPEYQSSRAAAFLKLAEILNHGNRMAEAETVCRQALGIVSALAADHPQNPEYAKELVDTTFLTLNALESIPNRLKEREQLLDRSLPIIERLSTEHPDEEPYLFSWGKLLGQRASYLRDQGLLDEEEKTFLKQIEIGQKLMARSPDYLDYQTMQAGALHWLGRVLVRKGRFQEGEAYFRRALEIKERLVASAPDIPQWRLELAEYLDRWSGALSTIGLHEKADAGYRRSLHILEKLTADFPIPYTHFSLALALTRYAFYLEHQGRFLDKEQVQRRALEGMEKMLAGSPRDTVYVSNTGLACFALGRTCSEKGLLEEAERLIRRSIDLLEKTSATFYLAIGVANLGDLLPKTGRFREAENAYRRAITLSELAVRDAPEDVPARIFQAEVTMAFALMLHKAGRQSEVEPAFRQAEVLFERLIAADPPLAEPRFRLAVYLADFPDSRLRDPARAVALAEKATELAPREPDAWVKLGLARYRAGDGKGTIEAMDKALEFRSGGDGMAWFFLAMAHCQLGERDQARKEYNRAVQWMETNGLRSEYLLVYRSEAAAVLGLADLPADVFARP